MTIYLTASVAQRLAEAQQVLDAHVMVLRTGACLRCGTPNSCLYRDTASATFARYRRLPLRRPGASQPEQLAARRIG